MPTELARISANRLRELPRAQTVFFFPVGPLEDHGPHLPLGLDLAEAAHLCRTAAERLEKEMPGWVGVLMPSAPLGIDAETSALALTVRPHVLRDWLVDSGRALAREGFQHFVCFSGQLGPRQLTAIEEAGKLLGRMGMIRSLVRMAALKKGRPALASASSCLATLEDMKKSPFWPDPSEHGGRRDTSVGLVIAAADVDPKYRALIETRRTSSYWTRALQRWRRETAGYWGDPAKADPSEGERILSGTLDQVFPKLRAVWEGANPHLVCRSWYSVLPPNKGFFKAWLLLFAFVAVVTGWIFLTLRGL